MKYNLLERYYALTASLMCCGAIMISSFSAKASENYVVTDTVDTLRKVPVDTVGTVPDYTTLGEFVVTRTKPVIQANGEKVTYNVSEDPASKSATVLDMLRKVPMVTVDGNDNILVKGQSNFKIYVNGKEDPMLSANAKQVLKAMPASQIMKIEVINEPGAKYDAEGTAGILNFIIDRKQSREGYSGSLDLGVSRENIQAAAFAKARVGKVTGSVNLIYADQNLWDQVNRQNSTTEYFNDTHNHFLKALGSQRTNFGFWSTGLDLSWEPDTLNLFTVNFNFRNIDARFNFKTDNTMFDIDNTVQYDLLQQLTGKMINRSVTAGASYQHLFGVQNHNLIVSYLYNYGFQRFNWRNISTPIYGDIAYAPYTDDLNESNSNEHTVQVDYTNPFGSEKHLLETGIKGIFRRNSAEGWEKIGTSPSELVLNPGNNIDMNQYQDIFSAYASYGGNYGRFSLKAGLRYEYTRMGIDFGKEDRDNFSNYLNDIVPNLALSYSFSPAHSLRLAYQMRISRPTIDQVNPYEIKPSETQMQKGNPDLSSEKSNKVSLTYSNFGHVIGGYISAEFNYIDNVISNLTYLKGNTYVFTYANLGKRSTTSLNGYFNWNITQKMAFNINGQLSYVDMRAPNPFKTNGNSLPDKLKRGRWTGSFGASYNYTMPGNVKWSAWGGKSWGWADLQATHNGWYYYGIGVSRSFLKKDALTVSLNASGFFEKENCFRAVYITPDSRNRNNYYRRSWNVGCSVTWNFGSLKTNVRKVGKNIVNDDKSSGGNKGQGGGGVLM